MTTHIEDSFISLINKLQDFEATIDPDLMSKYLKLPSSDGIRYSLDILKDDRFQNTESFKYLKNSLNTRRDYSGQSSGEITVPDVFSDMDSITLKPVREITQEDNTHEYSDQSFFYLWELFHDLARSHIKRGFPDFKLKTVKLPLEQKVKDDSGSRATEPESEASEEII
jgi:hypothetical protein